MKRDFSQLAVIGGFVLLVVLSALSHIPGMLYLATLLFIVPGLVLLASNTVLIYSTLALPIWVASQSKAPRWAVALAAAPMLLVAVGPFVVGKSAYDAAIAPHVRDDFALMRDRAQPPRSIRIEGDYESQGGCGDLCQKLLLHRYVEQVVLANQKGASTYRLWTTQGRCPSGPGSELANAAALQGVCIVDAATPRAAADIEIVRSEARLFPDDVCNDAKGRFTLWCVTGYTRFDIRERNGSDLQLVERRTRIHGGHAIVPFYIGGRNAADVYFMPGVRLTYHSDLSIREVLKRRYGWRLEEMNPAFVPPTQTSPGAGKQERLLTPVEAILSRHYAPGEVLTAAEAQALQAAARDIIAKKHRSQKDVQTLRAIILLPQLVDNFAIGGEHEQIVSLSPLIPDVVARLEAPLHGKEYMRGELGVFLAKSRPADLKPYTERLIALLKDPERSRYLGPLARRLDTIIPNAEGVLLSVLALVTPTENHNLYSPYDNVIVGLCRVSRANDSAMATRFMALISADRDLSWNGAKASALSGLAHTAGLDAARAAGARIDRDDERRNFGIALRQANPTNWPDNCGRLF